MGRANTLSAPSSESCSGYENPSEETPCRFESGPGHQHRVSGSSSSGEHRGDDQACAHAERDSLRACAWCTRIAHVHAACTGRFGVHADRCCL